MWEKARNTFIHFIIFEELIKKNFINIWHQPNMKAGPNATRSIALIVSCLLMYDLMLERELD